MSENAPIDLPDLGNISSPEEAQTTLNRLHADGRFMQVYLNEPGHPQYGDMSKTMTHLYRTIHADTPDPHNRIQDAMKEGLEQQQQEQESRVEHIRGMLNELNTEHGLEIDEEVFEDATPSEEKAVEVFLNAKKGDWGKVDDALEAAMAPRSVPRELLEAWHAYRDIPPSDPVEKFNAALPIVQHLRDSDRRALGLPPREPKQEDDSEYVDEDFGE